jgi:hypothetical protein
MTVHELMALLAAMPADATVVVEDPSGRDEQSIRVLRHREVHRVGITWAEANGDALVELGGPHTGVLLGSWEHRQ